MLGTKRPWMLFELVLPELGRASCLLTPVPTRGLFMPSPPRLASPRASRSRRNLKEKKMCPFTFPIISDNEKVMQHHKHITVIYAIIFVCHSQVITCMNGMIHTCTTSAFNPHPLPRHTHMHTKVVMNSWRAPQECSLKSVRPLDVLND